VGAAAGGGVTSMLQRCVRECRRAYGNLDHAHTDEVVVLSEYSGIGRRHSNPTQMIRALCFTIKVARCRFTP